MVAITAWHLVLALGCLDGGAAWDYKKNGADWSQDGVCGDGGSQSPIDLPKGAKVNKNQTLYLKYPALTEPISLYHNGYSIAATLPASFKSGFGISDKGPGSMSEAEAEAYRLWQINFHAPSEHTVAGERMPLEVQLMHKRVTGGSEKDSELAVVVVLFQRAGNEYSDFLDAITSDGLPEKPWNEAHLDTMKAPVDISTIVAGAPFYSYKGSLSVPPCESKVKYFVRQEMVPAAHKQLQEFEKILESTCGPNGNFRLTQATASPVNLMASYDFINNPTVVRPQENGVDTPDMLPPSSSFEVQCQSKLANFSHDATTLLVSDSPEMVAAKEKYHLYSEDAQASRILTSNKKRELASVQNEYDNAPGPVKKIELKWQLQAAEQAYKLSIQGESTKKAAFNNAKNDLLKTMMDDCVSKLKSKKGQGDDKAQEPEAQDSQDTPRYVYPEPRVDLPSGLAASPFTKGSAEPTKAGNSAAMISPNLRQPEMAAGGSVEVAKKQDAGKADDYNDPNILMALKLPVKPCDFDQGDLVNALAKSAHVDPSRLEARSE